MAAAGGGDGVRALRAGLEIIGPPEHTWIINFRVADLEAIVDELRAAGEAVEELIRSVIRTAASPAARTPRETGSSCGSRWRP